MHKHATFRGFAEFWHFTRPLSEVQMDTLFQSLPRTQQKMIRKSLKEGGWMSLLTRNSVDRVLNELRKDKDNPIDLIACRCKAFRGDTVYVKKTAWEKANLLLSHFKEDGVRHAIGGLVAEPVDDCMVLIKKEDRG